eukprot:scaffold19719_cov21-Tisochrysis_lutea.AAC.3
MGALENTACVHANYVCFVQACCRAPSRGNCREGLHCLGDHDPGAIYVMWTRACFAGEAEEFVILEQ